MVIVPTVDHLVERIPQNEVKVGGVRYMHGVSCGPIKGQHNYRVEISRLV